MVFKDDPRKVKAAIYYYVPDGGKKGKPMFMPVDKVDLEKLKHPVIRLDYEGPPVMGQNRYYIWMTNRRMLIAEPISTHTHGDFDACLQRDIREYLRIAKEYYEMEKYQDDDG